MANELTFGQLSTVLNSITAQATGKSGIAATNTSEFITQAQTALKTGYDPVINAVSQVLSYTIFSTRPYYAKFASLRKTNQQFGNHVRKLQVSDKDFEDDARMTLTDGQSVDMYTVNKPSVLQTNFYGAEQYQKSLTIFRDQLDCAFTTPEEFGRFISMVMTNASDMMEQATESTARMTLVNLIASKFAGDATNVIHLVTEYNDVTGLTLDSDTVKKPENFVPFCKWMFARITTLSNMLTERSLKYHVNISGKEISRHTPVMNQSLYLMSSILNEIDASVLSSVFNDEYLKMLKHEKVNFWQSIDTPTGINVTPSYIGEDGSVKTPEAAVVQSNILGVLFDEEAAGLTRVNQWSAPTPFNAKGGYTNIFWHFTNRYYNDMTENCIVFVLD